MAISPLKLHARTQSGKPLGQVVDVEIDPDSQAIISYHVKPSRLVPDMVHSPLLIHRSQVIEFTERELIVEDASVREGDVVLDATPST